MSVEAVLSSLLLLTVLFPFAAAGIVALSGRGARRAAMMLAVANLAVVAGVSVLGANTLTERWVQDGALAKQDIQFQPTFVPGSSAGGPAGVSQYGTTWTVLTLLPSADPAKPGGGRVQFFVGLDGLNVWLLALSAVMLIPAVAVSGKAAGDKPGAFYAWMFVLVGGAVGAFLSFDAILFYVFFELTLIPAFFLIGRWGTGSAPREAARRFFLYTLAGSLFTLVGIVGVVLTNPDPKTGLITFSIPDLMRNVELGMSDSFKAHLAGNPGPMEAKQAVQFWLFLALMAGFAVKVALFPFHTWLPAAYGEAPLGVTILLSAVLAKLGAFGILRLVLPLTPDAAIKYGLPLVGSLAACGIVYGALCAFAQRDMKRTIAYSSVSHLGFLVIGLFAFNPEGLSGATLHMVNHGVSTGGLFALLAFLADRYRTTDIHPYGGLIGRFPAYAFLFFVLTLASIGLPGLNNFVSEMLMMGGVVDSGAAKGTRWALAAVAAFGVLLSAWYMLTLVQKVFFNPLREPAPTTLPIPAPPPTRGELTGYGLLAALCLALGLFPQPTLDAMQADVATLTFLGDEARDRVAGQRLVRSPRPKPERPVKAYEVLPAGQPNPAPKDKGKGGGKKKDTPKKAPPATKKDTPATKKDAAPKKDAPTDKGGEE